MARAQQDTELNRSGIFNHADGVSHATEQQQLAEEIEQVSLPPTDRGKEAWLVLAGCSLIQIPVWGMRLPRGVC